MITPEQTHAAIVAQMTLEKFEEYSERAAILEFDAKFPRQQAEILALHINLDRNYFTFYESLA